MMYFFSFDELYLKPFNSYMTSNNIERSKLSSEYGYLLGTSKDLTELVKDSIKYGFIEYYYRNRHDNSDHFRYYSTIGLETKIKSTVDSLNLINKALSAVHFKMKAVDDTNKVLEHNISIKRWISFILGITSCVSFFVSSYLWYLNRNVIDK